MDVVRSPQTVAGLFDDQIDAEHALAALRKAAYPPEIVSVLARDRANSLSNDSTIDVTRAVMDTALSAMSGWLTRLAALMVPESGTFLAAGPIGAMLVKIKPENRELEVDGSRGDHAGNLTGTVGQTIEHFGFLSEEAYYLENRLAAGSVLIAVTSIDRELVETTLRVFADHDAVYIGQATSSSSVLDEVEHSRVDPPESQSIDVIVADVVVTMRSARTDAEDLAEAFSWCGLDLLDVDGVRIGEIDDVLVDSANNQLLRYLIVAHGGVLGIARRRTAVPASIAQRIDGAVQLGVGQPRLAEAPTFDPSTPFSRKDELAINDYFGVKSYWIHE